MIRAQRPLGIPASLVVMASFAVTSLGLAGCATNLSTLQTADVVSLPGVRVSGGAGLFVPGGGLMREMGPGACEDDPTSPDCISGEHLALLRSISAGDAPQLDLNNPADEAAIREMFQHAAGLALFPPAPMAELSVRTGLPGKMDVGVKLTPLTVRADVKKQIFNLGTRGSGASLAVLAGGEYFNYDWLMVDVGEYLEDRFELLQYVQMDSPSRIDGEVALIASFRVLGMLSPYAAAKYRMGSFKVPLTLTVPHPIDDDPLTVSEEISGLVHFAGGTVGVGVGARLLRFFAEVTAMTAFSDTEIRGEQMELNGLAIYPAIGVAIELP